MMIGFFAGGIGDISLALVLSRIEDPSRLQKIGSALVLIAGTIILIVGLFPTDLEGSPATTQGIIHSIVSQIVFMTWPLGMLLISFAYGRKEFFTSLFALVVAGAISASNQVLALNINGLSERIFIAVLLAWSLLMSFRLLKTP